MDSNHVLFIAKDYLANYSPEWKRPPNSFILYRKAVTEASIAFGYRAHDGTAYSTKAASMWDEAEPAVKQFFMNLAHDIKSKHSSAFPDFTWSVKKQVSNGQDINSKAPRKRSKPVKVANVPVLNLEPQLIYHPSFTLDNNMHQQQLFPKSADLFKMNSWAVSTPLDPNMVSGFWDSRWACQDDFLGSINSSSNVVTIGLAEQAMYSSPELIVNTQISHSKPETASAIFAFPENDFRGQALPKIDIALSPAANELDTWSALFKTPTMPSFAY